MEVTVQNQHELGKKRQNSQTNQTSKDTHESARYVPALKRIKHSSLPSGADFKSKNCVGSNNVGMKHDAPRTATTDFSYSSGLDEVMIDNEDDLKLHLAGNRSRNELTISDKNTLHF